MHTPPGCLRVLPSLAPTHTQAASTLPLACTTARPHGCPRPAHAATPMANNRVPWGPLFVQRGTQQTLQQMQFSTSRQPLSLPLGYVILPLQQVKLSRGQHHRCVQSQVTQLSSWRPTVRVSPDALHAVNMVGAQCLACCVLQVTHRSQAGDSRDWHTQRGSVFHTTIFTNLHCMARG